MRFPLQAGRILIKGASHNFIESFLMSKRLIALLVASACIASAQPASAAIFDWTLTGADAGSGTISTGAASGTGYDITAMTGTINSVVITGLLGGQPGSAATSPSGAFIYDNVLYPDAAQLLDNSGILISVAGMEGNIWGNHAGSGGYSYYQGTCAGCYTIQNNADTFALSRTLTSASGGTAAPEPAALSLLGLGIISLSLVRRRRLG